MNFDAIIARHNLDTSMPRDPHYVCQLSEAALPAITAWTQANERPLCDYVHPRLFEPQDWREWGFRNMRTRHSLAAMEPGT